MSIIIQINNKKPVQKSSNYWKSTHRNSNDKCVEIVKSIFEQSCSKIKVQKYIFPYQLERLKWMECDDKHWKACGFYLLFSSSTKKKHTLLKCKSTFFKIQKKVCQPPYNVFLLYIFFSVPFFFLLPHKTKLFKKCDFTE